MNAPPAARLPGILLLSVFLRMLEAGIFLLFSFRRFCISIIPIRQGLSKREGEREREREIERGS
jgi:hypothetical protein